jgi:hypothetical protein
MDSKQLIENALGELYIIIDGNHSEQDLQDWFERNPIVFDVLGYKRTITHPRLMYEEEEYIFDFMAQNILDLWEIIEIKKADANILKDTERRHAFFSTTEKNLSQCREYNELFRDSACRKKFNTDYKTNCHKTPDITMIVGRNDGYDKLLTHELLNGRSPKIKLITYDDISNILNSFVENAFGQTQEEVSGLFITCTATLLPSNTDEAKHIFDINTRNTNNRVQLFIYEERIHVIATDSNGETVIMKSTVNTYKMILKKHLEFCLQIENHTKHSSIELFIDGVLVCESRTRDLNFDFTGDHDVVIGSDQHGRTQSSMLIGGNIILSKIPLLHEKWMLRKCLENLKDENGKFYVHEYIGNKFMHNCGHKILGSRMAYRNDLIQEGTARKPILRYVQ